MGNEFDLDPEISDDLKEVDFSDSPPLEQLQNLWTVI